MCVMPKPLILKTPNLSLVALLSVLKSDFKPKRNPNIHQVLHYSFSSIISSLL
jgi:hypothetical protein